MAAIAANSSNVPQMKCTDTHGLCCGCAFANGVCVRVETTNDKMQSTFAIRGIRNGAACSLAQWSGQSELDPSRRRWRWRLVVRSACAFVPGREPGAKNQESRQEVNSRGQVSIAYTFYLASDPVQKNPRDDDVRSSVQRRCARGPEDRRRHGGDDTVWRCAPQPTRNLGGGWCLQGLPEQARGQFSYLLDSLCRVAQRAEECYGVDTRGRDRDIARGAVRPA